MKRRLAVLCAPFRSRTDAEASELRHAKAALVVRGWVPIFLPDTLAEVLDDEAETERRVALACSVSFVTEMARVTGAMMVVVGDRMTEGMKLDVSGWLDAGGPAPLPLELMKHAYQSQEEDGDAGNH